MKKRLLTVLALVLALAAVFTLASCGSSAGDYAPGVSEDSSGDSVIIGEVNRKIYYIVSMTLETADVPALGKIVKERTADCGGYLQYSNESVSEDYAYYSYTVKIPTEQLNEFLAAIDGSGKVTDRNIKSVDITTEYVSAEARLDALVAEKAVLTELMESATSIYDVLEISNRIASLDSEIGELQREINSYDSLIDYSTVSIYIHMPYDNSVSTVAIVVPIVIVVLVVIGVIVVVIVNHKKKKAYNSYDGNGRRD